MKNGFAEKGVKNSRTPKMEIEYDQTV